MPEQSNERTNPLILREMFREDKAIQAVEKVLPKAFKGQAERFLSRAILTFKTSDPKVYPRLAQCTPESFFTAVCTAAECGFALDNYFAYMIPYGRVCTCEFDFKAIVVRARRSGTVTDIRPQIVHENDDFEFYEESGQQHYRYRPCLSGDPGPMKLVYAVATFPGGGFRFGYMTRDEIAKVRKASKSPDSPAWKLWESQMWCKAAIKRLSKGLLDDPGVIRIIELDNQLYDPEKVVDGKVARRAEANGKSLDDLADAAERMASPRITELNEAVDYSQGEVYSAELTDEEKEKILAMERAEALEHGR